MKKKTRKKVVRRKRRSMALSEYQRKLLPLYLRGNRGLTPRQRKMLDFLKRVYPQYSELAKDSVTKKDASRLARLKLIKVRSFKRTGTSRGKRFSMMIMEARAMAPKGGQLSSPYLGLARNPPREILSQKKELVRIASEVALNIINHFGPSYEGGYVGVANSPLLPRSIRAVIDTMSQPFDAPNAKSKIMYYPKSYDVQEWQKGGNLANHIWLGQTDKGHDEVIRKGIAIAKAGNVFKNRRKGLRRIMRNNSMSERYKKQSKRYLVTKKFTSGYMKGMTVVDESPVPLYVGFKPSKPYFGSPYIVTKTQVNFTGKRNLLSNSRRAFPTPRFVGKGEFIWKKISRPQRMNFLIESFRNQITDRDKETLAGRAWSFLPSKVKIVFSSKVANVELNDYR